MNNKKETIDELIHKSLSAEEAKFYDELDEEGLFQKMLGLFQGKMKWINIITIIVQFCIIGLAIHCLIQFLEVTEIAQMIRWGAGLFACMLMSSFIKMQHWLQMETNSLKRELKRLEFQVSVLAEK